MSKTKEPMVDIHLRMSQRLHAAIARSAKRQDRTTQGEIRHAIVYYLMPVEPLDADD